MRERESERDKRNDIERLIEQSNAVQANAAGAEVLPIQKSERDREREREKTRNN